MEAKKDLRNDLLDKVDEVDLVRHHFRTMFTAGMGFFTDAYDLFIIGVVIALLTPIWHLDTSEIALLGSSSLIAAAIGAYLFGRLADIFGRKAIYGLEVIILTIGAIGSAFSQDITQLIIWRIVLGLGIGGDYPISAIIMSEYANRKDRGKLVSMVFSLQGIGLIAGPMAAILILMMGVPHDVAWRILLALGAIPAASVIYLRRKIKETPYYSLNVKGDTNNTVAAINDITGTKIKVDDNKHSNGNGVKLKTKWHDLFKYPNNLRLLGTAGSWFLLDWAFYGNSISWPLVMKSVIPNATFIQGLALSTIVFVVFAAPFYWLAAFSMDKLGRKFIQILGFLGMAICYLIISLTSFAGYMLIPAMFVMIFGLSYVFTEFGPNVTTFVYPSEVFPTPVRGFGDGISAGTGKFGAFLGTLLFPFLMLTIKVQGTFMVLVIISFLGAILTAFALPEPKEQSLRVVSEEEKYAEADNSAVPHKA
ncbi:MAG: MFS transporter [Deltaproteobacteria bacterium]|nr:MFS transporter [Deltaproteobacteria bacterium]